jgi:putative salt-induced outer membrane protein YdiY
MKEMNHRKTVIKISQFLKWSGFLCLMLGIFSAQAQTVITNRWTGDVSAGLTITRGNSQTTLANLTANIDRKTTYDEWNFGGYATYGEARVTVDGVTANTTTAQQADGFGQYNRLFTERFYALARLEGFHDDIADIHYRVTASTGVGYYIIKNKRMDLAAELGPGYVSQSLGNDRQNFVTMRAAEKFNYHLSDRSKLWESAEIDPDLQDTSIYIVTFEVGISADLTASKNLSLEVYFDDNYNSEPAPGRQSNDSKLFGAVDYKF